MKTQLLRQASFGGRAFGAPGDVLGQPVVRGPAAEALEKVNQAQRRLRGIERNLDALELIMGPENALGAFEQAQENVSRAWNDYVQASKGVA